MPATHVTPDILYAPHAHAPFSGVYRVFHVEHRAAHSALVIRGDEYPTCRVCGDQVRYELWMEADYMTQDWDLSGSIAESEN